MLATLVRKPSPRRSEIPCKYSYPRPPMSYEEIMATMRHGEFLSLRPIVVRAGQLFDKGAKRPEFYEFIGEMSGGLIVLVRPDGLGLPQEFTSIPVESHSRRQEAVSTISHDMGVNLAALAVRREHDKLGWCSITAVPDGKSFLYTQMMSDGKRKSITWDVNCSPEALPTIYAFESIAGSGQRMESSLMLCIDGVICTTQNHEGVSYTEQARLAYAFSKTPGIVFQWFYEALDEFNKNPTAQRRLEDRLFSIVRSKAAVMSFARHRENLMLTEAIGEHPLLHRDSRLNTEW